jgi:NAD(P)-dependent dehydrogenase (short-subunit alcohol dehydrogenase family)
MWAAKGALSTYSKALANEFATHGVRANRVSPGLVANDAISALMAQHADGKPDDPRNAMIAKWTSGIRLGRPGSLTGVAELVAFLVSDHANWISGSDFRVDGGSFQAV